MNGIVSVFLHWHHWLQDSSGVRQRQRMHSLNSKKRGKPVQRNISWKPMIAMDRKIQRHILSYKSAQK